MERQNLDPWALKGAADATLERTASQLRDVLKDLASRLSPFPSFLNMKSIQAIEVEPIGPQNQASGCVVVCEDGELYELSLEAIPGPGAELEVDQVEVFKALEMPPEEYIPYAFAAIQAMASKLESK